MNKTNIEYLDFTSNPIVGCDMTLPCAERCWARRMAHRLKSKGVRQYQDVVDREGKWTGKTAFNETTLTKLLRRRGPASIGLCFMGDAFHESVPDEWLDRMLAVVALTPHLRYILPTKRAKRMKEYWADTRARLHRIFSEAIGMRKLAGSLVWKSFSEGIVRPLPNVGLMLSASNQSELEARIGDFLSTPAALHVLSLEPLLGAVDLESLPIQGDDGHVGRFSALHGVIAGYCGGDQPRPELPHLDWAILGGESGPGTRPMPPEWPRTIRDQCVAAAVPYFHKQNGEWATTPVGAVTIRTKYEDVPIEDGLHHRMFPVGKKAAGRLLDGQVWDQRPEGWGYGV